MMSRTSSPTPWHALSNKLFLLVLCFLCCGAARQQANPEVLLKLDDITGPWFSAKGISARLATQGNGRFEAQVAEFTLFDRTVRHLKITCAQFRMIGHELNCGDGAVHLDTVTPLTFVYSTKSKTLELNFRPGQVEAWRVFASHGDKNRFMTLSVGNGVASRYNQWIPESWPRIASGRIFGYFEVSEEAGRMQAKMNFSVQDFSFSDAASRHAGEKIAAVVSAELQGSGQTWRWKSEVEWQAGQVYWHPVYFPGGGHKFVVDGSIEKETIDLRHARLTIAGIGELQATGRWSRPRSEIDDLTVWTDNVKLGALHKNG